MSILIYKNKNSSYYEWNDMEKKFTKVLNTNEKDSENNNLYTKIEEVDPEKPFPDDDDKTNKWNNIQEGGRRRRKSKKSKKAKKTKKAKKSKKTKKSRKH